MEGSLLWSLIWEKCLPLFNNICLQYLYDRISCSILTIGFSISMTSYSSCFYISKGKIISIFLGIQLNIRALHHEKLQKFQERIRSVLNSYLLVSFFYLTLIISFIFLIITHFPSFLAYLIFSTSLIYLDLLEWGIHL